MVSFSLGGDPASIRASATQWSTFGESAGSASSDIKGIDSSEFSGDEAETFRDKVNNDLPPHLDKTSEAWGIVSAALTTYAGKLEGFQSQLSSLKTQHDNQQQKVTTAQTSLSSARSADRQESTRVSTASLALKPGETLPPSTYVSHASGAQSTYNEVSGDLQDTINAANQVRSDHTEAVRVCCNEINRAKGMRFEKPPGFWGKLKNSVVGWVKDHADILKKISGVLKIISAVAGVLAMIPVLAPVMGPIALVAGGAALAIDVTLKLCTGEGSWGSIIFDAATMALPGVGKLMKPLVMGSKAGKAVNAVGVKGVKALSNSKVGKTVNSLANTKVGKVVVTGPGRALNKVNTKVAQGMRKVPGLNKLPNERVLTLKYKKGWTPEQRAELDMKAGQMDRLGERGQLIKTKPPKREADLRGRYARSKGMTKDELNAQYPDSEVDHIHELQLGGEDNLGNTQLLNGSVNGSSGKQIDLQIAADEYGSAYDRVVTAERP